MNSERILAIPTDECFHLLASTTVGRVALTRKALPVILPVNYAVDGDTVVIRTRPGSLLASSRERGVVVAFEVDELDRETCSGWSVLVTGTLREITDVGELARAEQLPLVPWVGGDRRHFVRITPGMVSGRRIPSAVWSDATDDETRALAATGGKA
ncbi:MAG TPA: pyridoxamine 5'-phosphate oxidase family protein [Actinomycetales bacterium]|nr:pyridoxamine 5'-phosphate oxidase family protein [Actinomycetales bacterium]